MPSTLSYPGVYVEEIPSGVRTIAGVATSIAAFVGLAPRGPVDVATTITSWADFERTFGGLVYEYPLGYAVRDFYENGGNVAVIVRTFVDGGGAKRASIARGDFKISAASPGLWGNDLRFRADQDGITDAIAADLGVPKASLYNLTIRDTKTGVTETYNLVTKEDTLRRVDRVLARSSLVKLDSAVDKLPAPLHKSPIDDAKLWTDDEYSTKVADADKSANSATFWGTGPGDPSTRTGIYALDRADLFNLLVLAPDVRGDDVPIPVLSPALNYCVRRRALMIVDPRHDWATPQNVIDNLAGLGLSGDRARNAAIYFPRVLEADLAKGGMIAPFGPAGMIAGIMARTDTSRGVWKAPAGVDAALSGALGLEVPLNDLENGQLNPIGVNCLRTFPITGNVVWGARTMRGADLLGDDYKYVPVRRLALFLEESLYRGLQWVVFEPNDEPLWSQIRLNVGAFMHNLFRQGAFQGASPRDAYFVLCDATTTTQNDINLGIVNIIVGFAPLKPAEFVVLKIQQIAGQIQT
jgi:phage tail sheath protein FI